MWPLFEFVVVFNCMCCAFNYIIAFVVACGCNCCGICLDLFCIYVCICTTQTVHAGTDVSIYVKYASAWKHMCNYMQQQMYKNLIL